MEKETKDEVSFEKLATQENLGSKVITYCTKSKRGCLVDWIPVGGLIRRIYRDIRFSEGPNFGNPVSDTLYYSALFLQNYGVYEFLIKPTINKLF